MFEFVPAGNEQTLRQLLGPRRRRLGKNLPDSGSEFLSLFQLDQILEDGQQGCAVALHGRFKEGGACRELVHSAGEKALDLERLQTLLQQNGHEPHINGKNLLHRNAAYQLGVNRLVNLRLDITLAQGWTLLDRGEELLKQTGTDAAAIWR